ELSTAKIRRAAGKTVEAAAPRGMDQIDHLQTAIIVALSIQDLPSGRPHQLDVREIPLIIVDFFQLALFQILQHAGKTAFSLSEEHGIGMFHGFIRMEHGGDPAENDRYPPGPEFCSYLPSPLDLAGEHAGYRHQVGLVIEIDLVDMFVCKHQFDIFRDSRCKADRSVGGKIEICLALELGPFRVYKFHFHACCPLLRLLIVVTNFSTSASTPADFKTLSSEHFPPSFDSPISV